MSTVRLPAHLEMTGLLRRVQAAGGFATVVAKGEPDAGTLLIVTCCNGADYCAWERMPQADGERRWQVARHDSDGRGKDWNAWLERRRAQDPDLWIVELDIAQAERFIG